MADDNKVRPASLDFHLGMAFTHIPGVKNTLELIPYQIDVQGDTKYWRYTSGKIKTPRGEEKAVKDVIFKESKDGSITTTEKAYAMWDDRASADYIPVNDPFDSTGATTFM